MNDDVIRKIAEDEFRKKYPDDTEVEGSVVVLNAFSGNLVVIKSKEKDGGPTEEICYVSLDKEVTFFRNTDDLARFLETNAKRTWWEKLLSKEAIRAICTLGLLITLCALFFKSGSVDPQLISILGTAIGGAVGYVFGSSGQRGS